MTVDLLLVIIFIELYRIVYCVAGGVMLLIGYRRWRVKDEPGLLLALLLMAIFWAVVVLLGMLTDWLK